MNQKTKTNKLFLSERALLKTCLLNQFDVFQLFFHSKCSMVQSNTLCQAADTILIGFGLWIN